MRSLTVWGLPAQAGYVPLAQVAGCLLALAAVFQLARVAAFPLAPAVGAPPAQVVGCLPAQAAVFQLVRVVDAPLVTTAIGAHPIQTADNTRIFPMLSLGLQPNQS